MQVYVVFKTEIMQMCYEYEVFDSVHSTKEKAQARVKELNQYDKDSAAYVETKTLDVLD